MSDAKHEAGSAALEEYRRKVASGEIERAERAANPYEQALRKPSSKVLAIKAKCWSCQGEGEDVGWRVAIRDCNVTGCALHPHRPYQRKGASDEDE